jgi:hypothetical protein
MADTPKHPAQVKNVGHKDPVKTGGQNGMVIIDNRKPKIDPAQQMVVQIEGAARNGSTQPLRNFWIWCQKRGLNADNYISEEREAELTQLAIRNARRIRDIRTSSTAAIAEAQTMNSSAPLATFLGTITAEDRESSDIRRIIFPAEKALEAFSL